MYGGGGVYVCVLCPDVKHVCLDQEKQFKSSTFVNFPVLFQDQRQIKNIILGELEKPLGRR